MRASIARTMVAGAAALPLMAPAAFAKGGDFARTDIAAVV